jgi:succinate dehydrogenase / fumarate reductase cytochrome b subunit
MSTTRPSVRPLSPHLQVYRWKVHMLVSIFHRATGIALATGGVLILVWWLAAAAAGPSAYATFSGVANSWLGKLVLFGLTWVFFQHLCSGLRHLYLDTGAGYELGANRRLATFTLIASALLTLAVWAVVLVR